MMMRYLCYGGEELEKANPEDGLPSQKEFMDLSKFVKHIAEKRQMNFIPGEKLHSFVKKSKNPYNFGVGK